MIKIQVFPENEVVETRTIQGKDDKPSREIFEQVAYAHLGGKFPVEMKFQLEKGQVPYVAGMYTIHCSSFIINNFGSLELKRFGLTLDPLKDK